MHIALFFGSFNPVHLGHLSIAQHVLNECDIDEVHFVLSPHNPFKSADDLWPLEKRWDLLNKSIASNPQFRASDIELQLETPNYTTNTLKHLESLQTGDTYSILMGSDTFSGLQKWQSPEHILSYPILVYPRIDSSFSADYPNVKLLESPLFGFSATDIRRMIKEGQSVRYLVRDEILELLEK